eukprot:CAMPEP_0119359354 /NCGR_PEP_ID=MMETSP1334-20130426/7261_1 /TAXON_ID=127549 /ORGANISM="Calcidiscus leptoporus, Strain RCC1130" /LENGTH=635 /DNA_ID=CAMNT_0007374013 /DNA_START=99 /DNA_END=2006 /DNA_ORIENTATION=+
MALHMRPAALARQPSRPSAVHVLRLRGGGGTINEHLLTVPGGGLRVESVAVQPFEGQKPGTSGLRRKTAVFMQPHYLESFVQCLFEAVGAAELRGATLVVSGDGRYHNAEAIQTIVKMAAAHGVARVWVGKDGLLSTPAASAVIREREGGQALGGIILTASHNPGGRENDFGIKFNVRNGGPALEALTSEVYSRTQTIERYSIADVPRIDLSEQARYSFCAEDGGAPLFEVEVIDPTEDWLALMRQLFDFPRLKALLAREDMSFCFDAMHGVAGVYAAKLFVEELGVAPTALRNCEPRDDFGGGHPDPNLTYASQLVETMGLLSDGAINERTSSPPELGAAADGDGDRNMILGKRFFVTPSDSVAIIAAHAHALPWLAKLGGLRALARSMPTSAALDRVAQALGLPLYETPTGWKFFGNLMDSELLGGTKLDPLICGEESFGTGSSHVREKDGLWAVLCWLSILAEHNAETPIGHFVGVEQIVKQHWDRFGRNYYCRYDYEGVDSSSAAKMMERLVQMAASFKGEPSQPSAEFTIETMDEFTYTDPVDGSVSGNQGLRVLMSDGSRIIVRLSGTGSVGATVRLYIERYQPAASRTGQPHLLLLSTADALRSLVALALELTQVREFTGREEPTVIT